MVLAPHQKVHALTPTPKIDAILRQIVADNPNGGEEEHRRAYEARLYAIWAAGGDEADAEWRPDRDGNIADSLNRIIAVALSTACRTPTRLPILS